MKKILILSAITAFIGAGLMAASLGGMSIVPEPVAMMLLGTSLVVLAGVVRRKNKKTN